MTTNDKTYLLVPYAEKDSAKALGARWDPARKQWYVPAGKDLADFAAWPLANAETAVNSPRASASPAKAGMGATASADPNFVAYSGDEPPWDV